MSSSDAGKKVPSREISFIMHAEMMAVELNKNPTLIHNTEKEIWLIWKKYKPLKENSLMILSLSS